MIHTSYNISLTLPQVDLVARRRLPSNAKFRRRATCCDPWQRGRRELVPRADDTLHLGFQPSRFTGCHGVSAVLDHVGGTDVEAD